jgi:peptide/nickel transport system ATP-binding protein
MYLGRVVESGRTEDVLQAPRHPYTQALLSVVPETNRSEPVVLTGEIPDPTRIPKGCRFHPRCPALAGGQAETAGVAEACRTVPLTILPAGREPLCACHLDRVRYTDPDVSVGSTGMTPSAEP